jgi:hypothetical protein
VTPTTEAPRPSGGVKAASSAGPQWWSPWYWFSLMTGQG